MNFDKHSELRGKHAFLSPSTHYWLNDEEEDLIRRYCASFATTAGTALHDFARKYITNRIKIMKSYKNVMALALLDAGIPAFVVDHMPTDAIFETLMNYVNDAIGFRMTPEVPLYYSDNCFGTTDSICYNEDVKMLRIHDFKSGTTKASMDQLLVYAALFFLDYGPEVRAKPENTQVELRIYQSSEILFSNPTAIDIRPVMEQIKSGDKILKQIV